MIIRSEEIYKKANSIVKSCGTRDTLKIARELGIHLHFLDNLNDLLGMYTYRHKERHILLNSNMEYLIMQMVCGHEIGHDTFHRDLAKGNEPLPEFVLFDMRTKHEYEANAFASHLIIDDGELIDRDKTPSFLCRTDFGNVKRAESGSQTNPYAAHNAVNHKHIEMTGDRRPPGRRAEQHGGKN